MSKSPVILIYSGRPNQNEEFRDRIAAQYPDITLLTADTPEEVRERLPRAEVLFALATPAVAEFLELNPNLRWFQIMGTGVERIAAAPRVPGNITITNIRGIYGHLMAEYALAYMLAHTQKIRMVVRNQDQHSWTYYEPAHLQGATVGIAGLGSIGREVVKRCNALGMRVIGLRRQSGEVDGVSEVYTFAEIDQFLPQCDFLVTVLPHTHQTVGMLTQDRFRSLKPSCFLVNVGRGTIYREEDLVEALQEGWLAGAALDVFPTEPLPEDSPLWDIENVYITPHISGLNQPSAMLPQFFENLDRYLRGEPLLNVADLERGY